MFRMVLLISLGIKHGQISPISIRLRIDLLLHTKMDGMGLMDIFSQQSLS